MKIRKYQINPEAAIYKPKSPFASRVINRTILSEDGSGDQILHVELDIQNSQMEYLEGQSVGVQPPGTRPGSNKPHKLRLYSIASPRLGDDKEGRSLSLCVKRLLFEQSDGTQVKGVASNYIFDWQIGDQVSITGPVGHEFILPEDHRTNLILIATGTGIAPMRAFLHHIYYEHDHWQGQIALFYSAKTKAELVYANQVNNDLGDLEHHPGFHFFRTCSRENYDAQGRKIYVQDLLYQNSDLVWPLLQAQPAGCAIYICGLKGMQDGLHQSLTRMAEDRAQDWSALYELLKSEGRWNVEVY